MRKQGMVFVMLGMLAMPAQALTDKQIWFAEQAAWATVLHEQCNSWSTNLLRVNDVAIALGLTPEDVRDDEQIGVVGPWAKEFFEVQLMRAYKKIWDYTEADACRQAEAMFGPKGGVIRELMEKK